MADLRENSHTSYRFGYLTPTTPLKVHTGARNGRTYLAVSFWRGIEPLDSIVVPVCVSKSDAADVCGPFSDPVFSTSNIERLNVGAPDPSTETPCASLHFIEAGNATMAVLLTADPASHPAPHNHTEDLHLPQKLRQREYRRIPAWGRRRYLRRSSSSRIRRRCPGSGRETDCRPQKEPLLCSTSRLGARRPP